VAAVSLGASVQDDASIDGAPGRVEMVARNILALALGPQAYRHLRLSSRRSTRAAAKQSREGWQGCGGMTTGAGRHVGAWRGSAGIAARSLVVGRQ
jgi:hypothetical protein